ncbi:16S rRNA (cytosine(967)-C(5))-methyltransferase RsmB [Anaerosacchariphilus polymeriproducens]|uniref:16S rRNA (cytosine(967)-C(5))-methyltransferase n=1 Tax=Anaerosacchariphilus polymeriproducens TaxID=1812858 RepID=A0A371AXP4_9FIRM|nr:16S rRNA (cytosine(967)-C(5))-methyltransferase RsmB [Anaerosacchariphilus polymeriproducens]RDU24321.1 16S rRNA (cytosine(967)-C(5))-methyltransferase RsmB [Anaerosacchariphilus polymeriproducens]
MTKPINSRDIILGILKEIIQEEEYSHIALRNTLDKYQYLEKQERAFITRVTEGTLEEMIKIDYILNQFSKVKVKKMKPFICNLLRISVYQILYMDSVPDSAACNEAVKIAAKRGFVNLKGFVNGVLRNIIRNRENIIFPDEKAEPDDYLSIMYSMPKWIVEKWLKTYGLEKTKIMLQSFFHEKGTVIRCNTKRISIEELEKELEKEGIVVKPAHYLNYALVISEFDTIGSIKAFQKGFFYVQDISSMLVAEVADPQKNNVIIDVCAAPGGKSLHLAEKLDGSGKVEARDLTPYKVGLIQENIEKSQLSNIIALQQDACTLDLDSVEQADILIADLPCSGLGVMNQKTDIKYKMTPEKEKQLVNLQRKILETVYQYVKKGGTLVYSTCTIDEEENIQNVKWLMERYPFQLESIDAYLPEELRSDTTKEGYLQLLPGIHQADGFFIAKLKRID